MRRSIALLIPLVLAPALLSAPAAHATAAGTCTITGTITFSPAKPAAPQGHWTIAPAVIQCRGLYYGWERIVGPGSFEGTGSYTALPSTAGGCLRQLGSGSVDYWVPTTEQDIHFREPHSFVLGGVGAFTTPTLRGTFQVAPVDDTCLSGSQTRALFVAEVSLARFHPPPPANDQPGS